jgi:dUTP pyrophosphatase
MVATRGRRRQRCGQPAARVGLDATTLPGGLCPMADMERVLVRLLREGARPPLRATAAASGYDLHACIAADVELSQLPTLVPTGLAMEVPAGLDAQIRPRSGLTRQGVLCTFGTLDADYRGELMVVMYTMAPEIRYTVHDGDRIAQLVIARLPDVAFEEATVLTPTARGSGGHGSTGR